MSDSTDTPAAPLVVLESDCVGRVKWFNNKSGFGFITLCEGEHKDKDIFVHYSTLQAEDSLYKYLVQGEYVQFDLIKSEVDKHEFHAANVSGIKRGLLMCQTHSLNNTVPRYFLSRPRRVFDDGAPRRSSSAPPAESSAQDDVGSFKEVVKRRPASRKRPASSAK